MATRVGLAQISLTQLNRQTPKTIQPEIANMDKLLIWVGN